MGPFHLLGAQGWRARHPPSHRLRHDPGARGSEKLGLPYKIRYLPWARVQQELADYRQNRLCELTWDASYKPERAEYAFYSVPLYYTHLGFFYLKRRFPEAPDLQTVNRSGCAG